MTHIHIYKQLHTLCNNCLTSNQSSIFMVMEDLAKKSINTIMLIMTASKTKPFKYTTVRVHATQHVWRKVSPLTYKTAR
jgi:hypothetical protein